MRKRSKYRPYRVDAGAGMHAIAMQHNMADDQLLDLGMAIHTSIERMRLGMGIEVDFHTLAAMVNVSLILCERGVGNEFEQVVKDAQDALIEILQRNRRTGKWAFSGSGLQAINAAAQLHEQQIALVPRAACRDAMIECRRRMQRGEVLNTVAA